jgi:4-hydroxyphenylpyruvate dioxygenase
MKVKGTYCYNVNEAGGGMQVIDLSNIDAPSGTRVSLVRSITSNGLTMQPIIAWYRDVLGFEPFWDITFHTKDVMAARTTGSGLRSIVMWDKKSGVKFATNEPLRPFFRDSQIAKFVDDNPGNGEQRTR